MLKEEEMYIKLKKLDIHQLNLLIHARDYHKSIVSRIDHTWDFYAYEVHILNLLMLETLMPKIVKLHTKPKGSTVALK